jgi:hypothetical protein
MNSARYIFLIAIFAFSISSCKKNTEGCKDPVSLNFNASAINENNSLCQFSKATFYASSNTFNGVEVSEILLTIGQTSDTIGVIKIFNQAYPVNCASPATLSYQFITGNTKVWFAEYKLKTGGIVSAQGNVTPSNTEDCVKIDILP